MAGVYSSLFIADRLPAGASSPYVTVPEGHVFVVRNVEVVFAGTASAFVALVGEAFLDHVLRVYPIGSNPYGSWNGRVVFPAGQQFKVQASGQLANVTVSGYDLLG